VDSWKALELLRFGEICYLFNFSRIYEIIKLMGFIEFVEFMGFLGIKEV
jgi:hypothetical protein